MRCGPLVQRSHLDVDIKLQVEQLVKPSGELDPTIHMREQLTFSIRITCSYKKRRRHVD